MENQNKNAADKVAANIAEERSTLSLRSARRTTMAR